MKKLMMTLCALFGLQAANAQVAYILPSPTDANEEVTLFIDISQSAEGTQNNALKAILTDHPDDDVYLWSWNPAEPVTGNGDWGASNEELLMTKVSDLLYSITFVPTEFYGVDGATFFANGISCLAKLSNGNEYDGEYEGEAKTEDLSVTVVPKLCDRRLCIFPEIKEQDDFIAITYDNNQEELEGLQNLGADECYVYILGRVSSFVFYEYVPADQVTSTPELQLQAVEGEPGKFRLIFIPEDLFTMLPEGEELSSIEFRIMREGFTYPGSPPVEVISVLNCD
ncbi:MAG: hypothetical protein MK081_12760 [Flavobacteriales bacterium]|nr:hypothetical protein [Flavobacteriales bacterium]